MKIPISLSGLFMIYLIYWLNIGIVSCKKTNHLLIQKGNSLVSFDTANTLYYHLKQGASRLFYLALKGARVDSILKKKFVFNTLIIPRDSVFLAAGLDSSVLSSLDSTYLRNLIANQLFSGNISDSALSQSPSFIQFTVYPISSNTNISLNSFYFGANSNSYLYINGKSIGNSHGFKASNGMLYFSDSFLNLPDSNQWQILSNRPEFSYFKAFISINDSLLNATAIAQGIDPSAVYYNSASLQFLYGLDSLYFYFGAPSAFNNTRVSNTLFVPINQAFINAGFPNVPAIRTYLLSKKKEYNVLYNYNLTLSTSDPCITKQFQVKISPGDSLLWRYNLRNYILFSLDMVKNHLNGIASESDYYFAFTDPSLTGIQANGNNNLSSNPNIATFGQGRLSYSSSRNMVSISTNINPSLRATIVEPDILCIGNTIIHGINHLL